MLGATTTAKCATGAGRQAITSKIVTALGIAITAHIAAMMALTVSTLMISVTSPKTVKSTPLTLTLNVATVPLLTMTLTSKGR